MGDVAEMMIDGTLCQGCGVFLNDEAPGHPCFCADCEAEAKKTRIASYQPPKPKVECGVCGRKVKPTGLSDHMRDAHQTTGAV